MVSKLSSPALVKAMADTIYHRGPDDEGTTFRARLVWDSVGFPLSTSKWTPAPFE